VGGGGGARPAPYRGPVGEGPVGGTRAPGAPGAGDDGAAPLDAGPEELPGFWRTATRPRMLGLLALALALAVVFAELGSWQLGRARSGSEAPEERGVVPLAQVLAPQEPLDGEAVAGPVEVEGTWADEPVQLVTGRAADGGEGTGAWVLAALAVDGTGAYLPVVRGWVPDPDTASVTAEEGPATLVGELALSQDPRGTADLPPGRLAAASSADLLNVWDGAVYAAHLVPVPDDQAAGLDVVPPPAKDTGINAQNVSYAFQWWVFAAFAVAMWLRVVHDVRRREAERREDEREEARARRDGPGPPDDADAPAPSDAADAAGRPTARPTQEVTR